MSPSGQGTFTWRGDLNYNQKRCFCFFLFPENCCKREPIQMTHAHKNGTLWEKKSVFAASFDTQASWSLWGTCICPSRKSTPWRCIFCFFCPARIDSLLKINNRTQMIWKSDTRRSPIIVRVISIQAEKATQNHGQSKNHTVGKQHGFIHFRLHFFGCDMVSLSVMPSWNIHSCAFPPLFFLPNLFHSLVRVIIFAHVKDGAVNVCYCCCCCCCFLTSLLLWQ